MPFIITQCLIVARLKLEDPVKGTAKLEDKLKQQWVFEPIIIA